MNIQNEIQKNQIKENILKNKQKNKTLIIKRIIYFILMILTCITIFVFSSQNGEKSKGISSRVLEDIINVLPSTKNLTQEQKIEKIEQYQFLIRKLAHFSIYTLLGITAIGFLKTFLITSKKQIIIALMIGVVYAITDEFHQLFSSGRSASPIDVLIDSFGVMFGILLFLAFNKIYKNILYKFVKI